MTMGIVLVAFLAARADAMESATMTSTLRRTEFLGQRGQSLVSPIGVPVFNDDVLSLDVALTAANLGGKPRGYEARARGNRPDGDRAYRYPIRGTIFVSLRLRGRTKRKKHGAKGESKNFFFMSFSEALSLHAPCSMLPAI